ITTSTSTGSVLGGTVSLQTTAANGNILMNDNLGITGGDVNLTLHGSGALTQSATANFAAGSTVTLTAGTSGFGTSVAPIRLLDGTTIGATSLGAGNVAIFLTSTGTLHLADSGFTNTTIGTYKVTAGGLDVVGTVKALNVNVQAVG